MAGGWSSDRAMRYQIYARVGETESWATEYRIAVELPYLSNIGILVYLNQVCTMKTSDQRIRLH